MDIPEYAKTQAKTEESFAGANDQAQQQAETAEESRKIRRLQLVISMVMSVIGQDPSLTLEEASELAAGAWVSLNQPPMVKPTAEPTGIAT